MFGEHLGVNFFDKSAIPFGGSLCLTIVLSIVLSNDVHMNETIINNNNIILKRYYISIKKRPKAICT